MKTVTVPGVELATVDYGAGVPVVFVHGFPLDHSMWSRQISVIGRNYRAIAPDLRGFGRSRAVNDKTTMAEFADDLAALLDDLHVAEPVVLCGLSMGGYIAFQFWLRHSARLRALVLCDTRANADSSEAAAARRTTADRVLREGPGFIADTMIPKLFARESLELQRECVALTRHVILSTNPAGIAAAARGMAERCDFTQRLHQISVPTLVLGGSEDVISTPEEMRGIAAAMANSRWVEVAGAAHMAPLEKPDEVTAALSEFLKEVSESETAIGS